MVSEVAHYTTSIIYPQPYRVVERKMTNTQTVNQTTTDYCPGCPDCGMVYSMFFHTQFHRAGCSLRSASPPKK